MNKIARALGLFSLVAIIPLATSGGAGAAVTSPYTANLESLGEASGAEGQAAGLTAEVHAAERDGSGFFLSVTWSIENTSDERVVINWLSDQTYSYAGVHFSGVTVSAPETGDRYHPITDSNGVCLCSGQTSGDIKDRIEPDEQVAYWSTFSVPEEAETLDVEIPDFDPIEDIPIS